MKGDGDISATGTVCLDDDGNDPCKVEPAVRVGSRELEDLEARAGRALRTGESEGVLLTVVVMQQGAIK